jgi:hypothetical protein
MVDDETELLATHIVLIVVLLNHYIDDEGIGVVLAGYLNDDNVE